MTNDRNDNVVPFTGLTKVRLEPDHVLESAKGKLQDVIVIGWDEGGEFWASSSETSCAQLLWLIEHARDFVMHESAE